MSYAAETIEGIARADAGANIEWKDAAYSTLAKVAAEKDFFTADDVMERLKRDYPHVTTRTLRAFGPVVVKAAKNGLIEQTKEAVPSKRSNQHNCPIRVWKSALRVSDGQASS